MDAVTYPDETVGEFIQQNLVPIRVPFDAKPLSEQFNVVWTPTLVLLDQDGKEHHRTTGFLPPEELIPSLLLGIGKLHFDKKRLEDAISRFDELLAQYAHSHAAAEAVYYRAVSRYKATNKAEPLKEAYQELQANYPSSEWAQRAAPYRLL
jgi:thioredoxin-related protein